MSWLGLAFALGALALDAETSTYDARAHTYTARGGVHVTWPPLDIRCDEAELVLTPDEKGLVKAVFRGHAVATHGDHSLRAARIVYDVRTRTLAASGSTHMRLALPAASPPALPASR